LVTLVHTVYESSHWPQNKIILYIMAVHAENISLLLVVHHWTVLRGYDTTCSMIIILFHTQN